MYSMNTMSPVLNSCLIFQASKRFILFDFKRLAINGKRNSTLGICNFRRENYSTKFCHKVRGNPYGKSSANLNLFLASYKIWKCCPRFCLVFSDRKFLGNGRRKVTRTVTVRNTVDCQLRLQKILIFWDSHFFVRKLISHWRWGGKQDLVASMVIYIANNPTLTENYF